MKTVPASAMALFCFMVCLFAGLPECIEAEERFQLELYGGILLNNPRDINLFSEAEQRYNDIFFIQRLRWMQGYFVNDFPEINSSIPGGVRVRYRLSPVIALSLGMEGFFKRKEQSMEGTFSYVYSGGETERHTKKYDPYRIELTGYSLLGGIHYRIPVGSRTDLEIGASAGWTFADFEFSSDWSYALDYTADAYPFSFLDVGSLQGDGSGSGFLGRALIRLIRALGRRVAFFVEAAGSFCRIKSLDGTGREIQGLTGEANWEGIWGIKQEEIQLSWGEATVLVPTNYWGTATLPQRERDFVLDLSGMQLILGIQIRL